MESPFLLEGATCVPRSSNATSSPRQAAYLSVQQLARADVGVQSTGWLERLTAIAVEVRAFSFVLYSRWGPISSAAEDRANQVCRSGATAGRTSASPTGSPTLTRWNGGRQHADVSHHPTRPKNGGLFGFAQCHGSIGCGAV